MILNAKAKLFRFYDSLFIIFTFHHSQFIIHNFSELDALLRFDAAL